MITIFWKIITLFKLDIRESKCQVKMINWWIWKFDSFSRGSTGESGTWERLLRTFLKPRSGAPWPVFSTAMFITERSNNVRRSDAIIYSLYFSRCEHADVTLESTQSKSSGKENAKEAKGKKKVSGKNLLAERYELYFNFKQRIKFVKPHQVSAWYTRRPMVNYWQDGTVSG